MSECANYYTMMQWLNELGSENDSEDRGAQPASQVTKVNFRPADQPPPALKYSREEILLIANKPQSKVRLQPANMIFIVTIY